MSASKGNKAAKTAAEEKAFADQLTESARPSNAPRSPVANVPPVDVAGVVITPRPNGARPPALDARYPRLISVTFRTPVTFDYASIQVSGVNMASGFYGDTYRRLEFCEFFGRLAVLVERKSGSNKGGYKTFRFPFESILVFATYEDNPDEVAPTITVNEKAPTAARS